jgi:predicted dehydrogenase
MVNKLGIIGASNIAFEKFLPALKKNENFEYVGVASRESIRAHKFKDKFGGQIYCNYESIINDPSIDSVYIPLPPALHYKWALKALNNNKHVLLEKPFTTNIDDTKTLLSTAINKNLAVHENYMFEFHSQIEHVKKQLNNKEIGDLKLININFGFPFRGENDFRYNKKLGGGSLFDCGGYTLKLANIVLGSDINIISSNFKYSKKYDVDMGGNIVVKNDKDIFGFLSFGMDNDYRCSLDLWGSKSSICYDRIFTCPPDINPQYIKNKKEFSLEKDDHFSNSINQFFSAIQNIMVRKKLYDNILNQGILINKALNFN